MLRITVVSESSPAVVNGVTNSVVRTLDHLRDAGHEAIVVAPGPAPAEVSGFPVREVRSVALPRYRTYRLGLATPYELGRILAETTPDLVHLAGPAVLGGAAAWAAQRLNLPTVAVFQTDAAGFASHYGFGMFGPLIWEGLRRVHGAADLTLVPSTWTYQQLAEQGIPRLARWPRGVDLDQFNPAFRSAEVRRRLAPGGETIIGYVGRVSREKRVGLLTHLADLPRTRLVVVGAGPAERWLRKRLPQAIFTGLRRGGNLSALMASLDVFVHTGANETFCQAVQEALAAGVPVVAPAAGGPVDLVHNGRNGLLYPPDDPLALCAAVRRLVCDPALRQVMGAAARQSVLGRTWAAIGEELLGFYQQVLTARSGRVAKVGGGVEVTPVTREAASAG
jgi:phosphatidylinositol alpha 1,6-mannosyltransferase